MRVNTFVFWGPLSGKKARISLDQGEVQSCAYIFELINVMIPGGSNNLCLSLLLRPMPPQTHISTKLHRGYSVSQDKRLFSYNSL